MKTVHELTCRDCSTRERFETIDDAMASEWESVNAYGITVGHAVREHRAVCPDCEGTDDSSSDGTEDKSTDDDESSDEDVDRVVQRLKELDYSVEGYGYDPYAHD